MHHRVAVGRARNLGLKHALGLVELGLPADGLKVATPANSPLRGEDTNSLNVCTAAGPRHSLHVRRGQSPARQLRRAASISVTI